MKKYMVRVSLALATLVVVLAGCAPPEVTSAKLYIRNKDWANARVSLERATQLYPDNAEAWKLLGDIDLTERKWAEARTHYVRAGSLSPMFKREADAVIESSWVQHFNNSVALLNRGDMERARQELLIAVVMDPEKAPGWRNLGFVYTQMDSVDAALRVYDRAIQLVPGDLEIRKNVGFVYFNKHDYVKTMEYLEPVIENYLTDGATISSLAVCYVQTDQRPRALALYERALQNDPENEEHLFNLAFMYIQDGNDEAALPYLLKVIETNPFDAESMAQIAFIYVNKNDDEESFPYLEKANELDPNNDLVWRFLGGYWIRHGEVERGTAAFARADQLEKLKAGTPPPATPPATTIPPGLF
jgi:tetratricopeptide (TPR) repeat protein